MSEHITERIKAVFFDHDDTLVGTFASKGAHHKHVARTHYGKELTDEELRLHWGKPLRELISLLYGTDDIEQAMAHNRESHEDFPKELFTASIPTLRRIKAAGKKVGIVTSTSRFNFEHDLQLHDIPRELLDYTQAEDDTPFHKPDPRAFKPALTWLRNQQINPREVIYVGDGLHDMKAALGAGFNFVGVETGLVTAEQFKKAGAKSIPGIADL